jgi:hypothetical protein
MAAPRAAAGVDLLELITNRLGGVRTAGTTRLRSNQRHSGLADGARQGPISSVAFLGVAVASFGGPLALAALAGPGLLDGAGAASGAAMTVTS